MRFPTRLTLALTLAVAALSFALVHPPKAQAQMTSIGQPVSIQTQFAMLSASATAAVNNQVTLTIPAPPPNYYNYVCSVHFDASQQVAAPAADTNLVTTSTNFNAWALKFSLAATASQGYDWYETWGIPNVGCAKSTSPGTATTFVSPAAQSTTAFTWTATYYQAP